VLLAEDIETTLHRIVTLAVETIEHCEHAGITVVQGRTISSPASSDEIPAIVDRLQAETGEGPCVDAIRDRTVFYTGHLSEELRWPISRSERAPSQASRASCRSGSSSRRRRWGR